MLSYVVYVWMCVCSVCMYVCYLCTCVWMIWVYMYACMYVCYVCMNVCILWNCVNMYLCMACISRFARLCYAMCVCEYVMCVCNVWYVEYVMWVCSVRYVCMLRMYVCKCVCMYRVLCALSHVYMSVLFCMYVMLGVDVMLGYGCTGVCMACVLCVYVCVMRIYVCACVMWLLYAW